MVDDHQPTEDVSPNTPPVADDRGTIQTYFAGDAGMTRLREAIEQQGSEPFDTVAIRIDHVETESATAGPISTETIEGRVNSPVLRTDVNDGITLFIPIRAFVTTKTLHDLVKENRRIGDVHVPELLTLTITEDGVPAHLDVEAPVDFDIKFSFIEKEERPDNLNEILAEAYESLPEPTVDESDTTSPSDLHDESELSGQSEEPSESNESNE